MCKTPAFWDVTSCILVDGYQLLGETHHLLLVLLHQVLVAAGRSGPKVVYHSQQWPIKANSSRSERTVGNQGQHWPIRANSCPSEPTVADQGQQLPIRANSGRYEPTSADQGQQ